MEYQVNTDLVFKATCDATNPLLNAIKSFDGAGRKRNATGHPDRRDGLQ
jgi:hypothetical protein